MQAEESKQQRGKLKIFFGAAAGVGKTYAMLEAAHAQPNQDIEVVVGYVETHKRTETEALLAGLEQLPVKMVDYRGTALREFDLDAALARHPTLILVDELAHTNAPGSRHSKRWQDVNELLEAGINVYTTVNVQHLESLNDVVAQVTGVIVRETIPDSFIEQADELELIDLPPDDLLRRLKEGKVYMPQQAEQATRSFFRKGNLIALRELALRSTADRVDAQMQTYMRDHAIASTWPVNECILVCVNPDPASVQLVRAARRMATRLKARWIVAYVETPAQLRLPQHKRDRLTQTLRLAEQLGAETVTLNGSNISEEILNYARTRNATKIVVGKPARPRWQEILFGSTVNTLVRKSGLIDVYVIHGEFDDSESLPPHRLQRTSKWSNYFFGMLVVIVCTVLAQLVNNRLERSNLIMLYLLGVVLVAVRFGRGPSIVASILAVAAFDFFYVPPYLTFAVSDTQYFVTFGVMLTVAVVISSLTGQIRLQAEAARQRERRTAALYSMSRELARTRGQEQLQAIALRHLKEVFASEVTIILPGAAGKLKTDEASYPLFMKDETEVAVAQWVFEHGQMAGQGTSTLPGAQALYLPLVASQRTIGVLGLCLYIPNLLSPEQLHLLENFATQTALAIERDYLTEETRHSQLQIETERMRNSLLSSVSHDLRTPLATITGAASSLLEDGKSLSPQTRRELLTAVYEEAGRLNRLVGNLLDMTRLESGAIQVKKEWQPLEEVVGTTLARLENTNPALSATHPINVKLPPDLPLVPLDEVLIEQVLINLLENALKYTPPGTTIEISATAQPQMVTVAVSDRGPGLMSGEENQIFDKFYRAKSGKATGGVGLGLTICRGIIEAHGGRIWAENQPMGGAVFHFTLPLEGKLPWLENLSS
jgi:two-component system sensor histidine kinase KdpD